MCTATPVSAYSSVLPSHDRTAWNRLTPSK